MWSAAMIGRNVARWLEGLKSENPAQRSKCAEYLSKTSDSYFDDKKVAKDDRLRIIEVLSASVDDPDAEVRRCVAHLVGILKIWSASSKSMLSALANDSQAGVQATALWAIGRIGIEASELADIVVALRGHTDRKVRFRVAWAIRETKPLGETVLQALLMLANDTDSTTRMFAFDAIAECISDVEPQLLSAVATGLGDKADNVRAAACRVVARIEGDWSPVRSRIDRLFRIRKLARFFGTQPHGVRLEALIALCERWPDTVHDPEINSWLVENDGYWWASKILAGERIWQ